MVDENNSNILPLIPLRDIVVFPSMVAPLFVGRDKSVKALETAMNSNKEVILVTQRDPAHDDPEYKDVYEIGTLGKILQLLRLPDGTVKVLIEGGKRVAIKDFFGKENYLQANYELITEINKIDSLELITMPKIFGYAFNPVSFIFCYSKNKLICTILKVNNTFSEDHYYINYAAKHDEGHEQNYDIEKLFHVSPFLPREGYYKIKYRNDNDCINFNIDYYNENNDNILETYITGKKITIENNFMIFANVFNSAYLVTRVIYLIHFQAVKLFFKKAKFYKKPKQNINKIT